MQLFGHWMICFLDLLQQIPCNWVSAVMTFSAGNPAFANGPGGESWIFHDLSGCRSKLGIIKLSLMHQFPTELNHLMHLGRIWGGAWCWIRTVCIFFAVECSSSKDLIKMENCFNDLYQKPSNKNVGSFWMWIPILPHWRWKLIQNLKLNWVVIWKNIPRAAFCAKWHSASCITNARRPIRQHNTRVPSQMFF